jgi:hypothetical protein
MSDADDDADCVKLPDRVIDLLDCEGDGDDPGPVVDDEPDAEIDFDMLHFRVSESRVREDLQRWGVEAQEEE